MQFEEILPSADLHRPGYEWSDLATEHTTRHSQELLPILETQESPSGSKNSVDKAQEAVELIGREHDFGRKFRKLTPIFGYSAAGSSPLKTFLNKTDPEYSACSACLASICATDRFFELTKVTGTTPFEIDSARDFAQERCHLPTQ